MSSTRLPVTALLDVGRAVCGDLPSALRREWLVSNGLGGYASGTVAGVGTRRYHGLLVAALQPPVGRMVLVAGLDAWANVAGARLPLSAHAWADGTVAPEGYRYLESFRLEGLTPVWTYALADQRLEQRVWMAQGQNLSYVSYTLGAGPSARPLDLEVRPLCASRDFHRLTPGDWTPRLDTRERQVILTAWEGAPAYWLAASAGQFITEGGWYRRFWRQEEAARGFDAQEDLYAPGRFQVRLAPGETWTLAFADHAPGAFDGPALLAAERARQAELFARANAADQPPFIQQLVLAADQFLVARGTDLPPPAGEGGRGGRSVPAFPGLSVIAGYHWFSDWGRDTMISLPGLTLATGRPEQAAAILRTFARYVDQGLLPNRFPDAGEPPVYNTVDATLWYFVAIHAYVQAMDDRALVEELLPILVEIMEWHRRGTRHGIRMDPADALLRAGEPGLGLTWMDACVNSRGWTPRSGKPVEVNALWHAALRVLAALLDQAGDPRAAEYRELAERVAASFRARFWRPELGYLADVIDTPAGPDDLSLRPNQLFAVSLPYPLLEPVQARAVVEVVGRELWTSYGLRSLAPSDSHYAGRYQGDPYARDTAYHQGTVWSWLLGPYAEAHYRVHGDREAAHSLLLPLRHHLQDAGLGQVSEIFDGDPPHTPRGCIAQAWGVAETLRVWRLLDDAAPSP